MRVVFSVSNTSLCPDWSWMFILQLRDNAWSSAIGSVFLTQFRDADSVALLIHITTIIKKEKNISKTEHLMAHCSFGMARLFVHSRYRMCICTINKSTNKLCKTFSPFATLNYLGIIVSGDNYLVTTNRYLCNGCARTLTSNSLGPKVCTMCLLHANLNSWANFCSKMAIYINHMKNSLKSWNYSAIFTFKK